MSRAGAGRKAEKPATSSRSSAVWWSGLACGMVLVLAPGSAILLGGLLAPVALLALLPSRHGGGRATQASLLFGLAACVHPLHVLWGGDTGPVAAIALLRQPMVLPTGWIALMAGWLVSEIASAGLRIQADIAAAALRRRMMARITEIEDEWGPMPAAAPLPPL